LSQPFAVADGEGIGSKLRFLVAAAANMTEVTAPATVGERQWPPIPRPAMT
jgi:hypothetical protein